MIKYKVIEIFYSIDGEGRRAGELTTFIRMSGCNCKCSWCDTSWSQDCNGGKEMTSDEILAEVSKYNCKNITLTGGEPLLQANIDELINRLYADGYDVNIETNGTIDPEPYLKNRNTAGGEVWATIDYKSKSSGMQSRMNIDAFRRLNERDVVKFVVGSQEELQDADDFIHKILDYENAPDVYFSPVFGMIEPVEIVEFMKKHHYTSKVKVQVQLHKIIWDPMTQGV